jgi:carboxymethylenebutenolidase
MRVVSFLAIFLVSVHFALAANGSMIQIPSGGEKIGSYLAKPIGKGPFPAVILIHEWWGLNDQIKGIADRLAADGYVALAVDLYRGKVATDSDAAHMLMAALSEDIALKGMQAAFAYLEAQPYVQKDHIASIGWCMGGGYSLQLALNQPKLAACVMYYGRVVLDPEKLKKLNCPVLGLFGEKDQAITPADAMQFDKLGEKLGKDIDVHVYKDSGHGFFNETGKGYNAEASKDAWAVTTAFLAKNLKKS